MTSRGQLLWLWLGYAFFPLYLTGILILAKFIPPPAPTLSGEEISAMFESGRFGILSGMALCAVASALFVPWSVAISAQLRSIEEGFPIYSWVQALSGVAGAVFFALSPFIWAAMAFRPHGPDLMLAMNDLAWLSWLISWPFFLVQEFALGLCILLVPRAQPAFSRWMAWYAICSSTTMFPVLLVLFFKTGPFAWTGIFGIYLPLALYAIWYHIVTYGVFRGIRAASQGR